MLQQFTLERTVSELAGLYQQKFEEARAQRSAYRVARSTMRVVFGTPFFAYMIFRLLVLDVYLPIYRARVRAYPLRAYHFMSRVYSRLARGYALGVRSVSLAIARAKR